MRTATASMANLKRSAQAVAWSTGSSRILQSARSAPLENPEATTRQELAARLRRVYFPSFFLIASMVTFFTCLCMNSRVRKALSAMSDMAKFP